MKKEKENFDLIISMGGNCAAAHNLLIRNLRPAAYPFDWTYFKSEDAVYVLAEGFKDGFKNYMLKENLEESPINPAHPDRIQYLDNYGKIIWANHFFYNRNKDKEYKQVKEKFDRRFKRLIDCVQKANSICFVFSVDFYIKEDSFVYLINALKELYPNKNIQIKVLSFNCEKDDVFKNSNIQIFYVRRKIHDYDFTQTTQEWSFLDNVSISNLFEKYNNQSNKILHIKRIKKGIAIYILKTINTIIRVELYLFGLRFDFCIGKVRK